MSARNENWNKGARELDRALASPCRGAAEEQLERLKERLLVPMLASIENAALIRELRWVANEAAALAWLTVCPMLVLPTLLEERISAALRRWERQQILSRHHAPTKPGNQARTCGLLAPAVLAA